MTSTYSVAETQSCDHARSSICSIWPSDRPAGQDLLSAARGKPRRAGPVAGDPRGGPGVVAGAISFWPLAIGEAGHPALLLGPLAVHPGAAKSRHRLALMGEGSGAARAAGASSWCCWWAMSPIMRGSASARVPEDTLIAAGTGRSQSACSISISPPARLARAQGLVLPPHRFALLSASLAVPHGRNREQQRAQA